jgi:hypothetical protein
MCTVIDEKNVTPISLSLELEQAVIRHEVGEDQELYVTEAGWFPFWIYVSKGNGQIVFRTYTCFRMNTSAFQRFEFANEVNSKLALICAYVDKKILRFDHCLLYRDGLTRESFIRACRLFNESLNKAVCELDPDRSILLSPGEQDEAEDGQ